MTSIDSLMTAPPVTALADEPLTTAIRRMHQHRVGSVLVMEGSRAVGIVTERDVLRATATGLYDRTVGAVMTAPVEDVDIATEVPAALAMMRDRGYRHMPVTDHGNPVGVVSLRDLMRVASIGPAEVPRGLKGVVVADTEVGDVRGSEGFYHYRQYSAVELAERRPVEDVWRLMIDGALPANAAEREAFISEVGPLRQISTTVRAVLPAIAAVSEPLEGLRTALSMAAAERGLQPVIDIGPDQRRVDALFLCAVTPTLLCALYRLRGGREIVHPRDDLDHAANYLWMLTGAEPSVTHSRAIEQYLISTIDHGFKRLHLHWQGCRLHRRRHGRLRGRCHRFVERPPSWRCAESGTGSARRDRFTGTHRGGGDADGGTRRKDHGLRARRVFDRRPEVGHASRCGSTAGRTFGCSRTGGVRGGHRRGRDRHPRPVEAGSSPAHECRVLRRRRHATVWHSAGDVHPDIRIEPGDWMVRQCSRAGSRQQDHSAERPLHRHAAAPTDSSDAVTGSASEFGRVVGGEQRCYDSRLVRLRMTDPQRNPLRRLSADHPLVVKIGRFGWLAKGVVYVVAGFIALSVAAKASGWTDAPVSDQGEASPTGAIKTVASSTGGRFLAARHSLRYPLQPVAPSWACTG